MNTLFLVRPLGKHEQVIDWDTWCCDFRVEILRLTQNVQQREILSLTKVQKLFKATVLTLNYNEFKVRDYERCSRGVGKIIMASPLIQLSCGPANSHLRDGDWVMTQTFDYSINAGRTFC